MKLTELFKEAKRLARLNGQDYQGAPEAYRADYNKIRHNKNAVVQRFSFIQSDIQVKTDRLFIGPDSIEEFTPGQYGAVEIWPAIYEALVRWCRL